MTAIVALARRELVRFLRQRNRVFGALVQPVLFWALFGGGLNASFRPSASGSTVGYVEYFYPGMLLLIVLFTAIFATISTIEDRNSGLLQGVLVAPVSPSSIALGKVGGTAVLAVAQAALLLPLAPLAGLEPTVTSLALVVLVLAVVAVALAGLGLTLAWRMDSTQGFHAVMTAFLMPMWLLSGAFFPAEGAPAWIRAVMAINPLTYALSALRRLLYLDTPSVTQTLPPLLPSLVVTLVFAVAMASLSTLVVGRARTVQ